MAGLLIRLFGALSITGPGAVDVDLHSAKAGALLAYLAVESNQAHRREKLAGLLWPDHPEDAARASLRRALADLRQAIADHAATPPYLLITRETAQLNTASDIWVDVTTFSALLDPAALSADRSATVEQLEAAVALYRAPFLDGFSVPDSAAFEEWALLTRDRLERLARQALYRLAEVYQAQGELAHALHAARRQLDMDPWEERAQRQVIELLALDGQRAAALAQYEACRQLMLAEFGSEPSEQTQALNRRVRTGEWPPRAPATPHPPDMAPRVVGECPYRGLAAFRLQDAAFFCGRDEFAARLAATIRQGHPVTALVGASGSGKSSLVFAGLLPRLAQERPWLVVSLRPGARPFHALAAALVPRLEPDVREIDQLLATQALAQALQDRGLAVSDVTRQLLAQRPSIERVLISIDQFEELYTLGCTPLVRQQFMDLLLAAVTATAGTPSHTALLLTLRADFMGQILASRPLADALQAGSMLLGPMTRAEMHEAIVRPAEHQGATFEAGLVERILGDVGDEPGSLPLLEFALLLLWEKQAGGWLTHAAYEEIGQATGALARYAEQVYGELNDADQERAQQIFMQLVRPGEGTDDTRRVARRGEIGEVNWPLVRCLADKRLVVTGREAVTGDETAEVAHEALIQRWARLRSWLDNDRAFRIWQEELRAALRAWESSRGDRDALLRGAALVQASTWLAARAPELSAAEQDYIQASLQQREQHEAERLARDQRDQAAARRTQRLLVTLAAVLTMATVVALLLSAFLLVQRRQTLAAYSLSLAANARQALDQQDHATALTLAMAATQIENPPPEASRVLMEAAYAPGARWRATVASLFPGAAGPACALAVSPDGRTALIGLADGQIVLWDLASRTERQRLLGHTGRVNDVAFSADGSLALSGGDDRQVILWNVAAGEAVRRLPGHTGPVRAVALSADGRTAASGGFAGDSMLTPGELMLWNLATGATIRRLNGHVAGVVAAVFTPDGTALLASSGDAEIFVDQLPLSREPGAAPGAPSFDMLLWDVASGEVRQRFDIGADDAFSLAISADGSSAATGSFYRNASILWDLQRETRIGTLAGHQEGVHAVGLSPDGRRALSASFDDSLILWDLSSRQPVARLNGHHSDVLDLAISPDGRTALSSDQDGGLILWDLVDAAEAARLVGHGDMVYDAIFTADGRGILSASGAASPSAVTQDTSLRLWDLVSGQLTRTAAMPFDVIFQVAGSPDGRTALLAASDPVVHVWDLAEWREVGRLEGHRGAVTGIEFTPDGQRALSISVDGTLILWDVPGRRAIVRLDGHGEGLWSLAISPDGRWALSDSGDSSMILWDLQTGTEIRSFSRADAAGEPGSSGLAFLPDGRTAISCEADGMLIQWDLASGREVRRLGQHPSLRTRAVITPDGRMAVTGGMDGSLRLWDLQTGQLVRASSGHGIMFDLALSPDGETIAAGTSDHSILVWRLLSPSLAALRAWVEENRYLP